ncbi:spore coat protein [Bacillus sp. N9]
MKRSAKEYTTAATEANCPVARQMFEQLLIFRAKRIN